jgi:streptogramin lyase
MKGQLPTAIFAFALMLSSLVCVLPAAAETGSISEYTIPTANSQPVSLVSGPDGALWFTEIAGDKIGRVTAAGAVSEYAIPTANSRPDEIELGPDNNLWFAEVLGNKIGRISPAGVLSEFPVPTFDSRPTVVASGPDGNVWFTERLGNKIGRITPSGQITEFGVPTPASRPLGIVSGPDGNLWFTELLGNKVGRLDPATRAISEYPLPTAASQPFEITAGPDGNLWFTEFVGNKIGRITTAGVITEFPLPTPASGPNTIRPGPDPNAATDCVFQRETLGPAEFAARYGSLGGCAASLATTKTLWFTEQNANWIAQITTDGTIFEFPIPTPNSQPIGIAEGPDGAVWFAELNSNKIGRLDLQSIGRPAEPGRPSGEAHTAPLEVEPD